MRQESSYTKVWIKRITGNEITPIIIIMLVFISTLFFLSDKFLTVPNILNVLRQVSILFIACAGMTLVLVSGGVDISIGSILAFAGVFSAAAITNWGWPAIVAVIFGILIGMVSGMVNGFIIIKTGIQPIIITLATMSVLRSFPFLYTNAIPVNVSNPIYKFFGQGYIGILPFPIILMLFTFIVFSIILSKTKFGIRLYAIGSNEKSARLSGINVNSYKFIAYTILGALSGLCGVMLTARIGSGVPNSAVGFEFDVLTAALIGGVSLTGGKGRMAGALIGCLIMGVLSNGLNILNISTYYQTLFKGLMLLLAVWIDAEAKKRALRV